MLTLTWMECITTYYALVENCTPQLSIQRDICYSYYLAIHSPFTRILRTFKPATLKPNITLGCKNRSLFPNLCCWIKTSLFVPTKIFLTCQSYIMVYSNLFCLEDATSLITRLRRKSVRNETRFFFFLNTEQIASVWISIIHIWDTQVLYNEVKIRTTSNYK